MRHETNDTRDMRHNVKDSRQYTGHETLEDIRDKTQDTNTQCAEHETGNTTYITKDTTTVKPTR